MNQRRHGIQLADISIPVFANRLDGLVERSFNVLDTEEIMANERFP